MLSGELREAVPAGTGVRDLRRDAGAGVAFGPRYIHDVRNFSAAPAVSVHAYSPPLTSMPYHDLDGGGVVPIKTLLTDDPEPAPLPSAS